MSVCQCEQWSSSAVKLGGAAAHTQRRAAFTNLSLKSDLLIYKRADFIWWFPKSLLSALSTQNNVARLQYKALNSTSLYVDNLTCELYDLIGRLGCVE